MFETTEEWRDSGEEKTLFSPGTLFSNTVSLLSSTPPSTSTTQHIDSILLSWNTTLRHLHWARGTPVGGGVVDGVSVVGSLERPIMDVSSVLTEENIQRFIAVSDDGIALVGKRNAQSEMIEERKGEPAPKRRKLMGGDEDWTLTRVGLPLHPLSFGHLCCGRIIPGGQQCVITRSIKKDMMIFDVQKSPKVPLRSFAFSATPNAIFAVPSDCAASGLANGLIVAEGKQLSIWDPRAHDRGGLIRRVQPGMDSIHSVDVILHANTIAFGGENRSVVFLDSRKLTPYWRWKNCLKYETRKVRVCRTDDDDASSMDVACVAFGVDSEISRMVGIIEPGKKLEEKSTPEDAAPSSGKRHGQQGDGRWLGCDAGRDCVIGITETGKLHRYVYH